MAHCKIGEKVEFTDVLGLSIYKSGVLEGIEKGPSFTEAVLQSKQVPGTKVIIVSV